MMRRAIGLAAVFALIATLLYSVPATAAPGDFDGDGILDQYDKWAKAPYNEPLSFLNSTNLTATIDGDKSSLPASLYWELGNATKLSVYSADITGEDVLGTRFYSGPVLITNATVRNLNNLNMDVEVVIGFVLGASSPARASAPIGGARIRGGGICLGINNVHEIVATLEALSGTKVTLFNLAHVLDQVKDALSNISFGVCDFVMAVKNRGKFIEILDQSNPFFPGIGIAHRITSHVWGNVNFDVTGWRFPDVNLGSILKFNNGKFKTEALATTTAAATSSLSSATEMIAAEASDPDIASRTVTTGKGIKEATAKDLSKTLAKEVRALDRSDFGRTGTEISDAELADLASTALELASLDTLEDS